MTQTLTLNRKKNNIVHTFYLTTKYNKIYSFTFPIKYSLILLYVPLSKQTSLNLLLLTHIYWLKYKENERKTKVHIYILLTKIRRRSKKKILKTKHQKLFFFWPLCLAHAVTNNNKSHVKNSTHKNPNNQENIQKKTEKESQK